MNISAIHQWESSSTIAPGKDMLVIKKCAGDAEEVVTRDHLKEIFSNYPELHATVTGNTVTLPRENVPVAIINLFLGHGIRLSETLDMSMYEQAKILAYA